MRKSRVGLQFHTPSEGSWEATEWLLGLDWTQLLSMLLWQSCHPKTHLISAISEGANLHWQKPEGSTAAAVPLGRAGCVSGGRKQALQHSWGLWLGSTAGFKHLTLDPVSLVSKTVSSHWRSVRAEGQLRNTGSLNTQTMWSWTWLYMAVLPQPFTQAH